MTTKSSLLLAALLLSGLATGCATADDGSDLSDTSTEAAVPAHFDLWETNGQYFFHVAAGNGEVMLSSEGYSTRTSALNGVLSVLDNGSLASRYVIKAGADGQRYVSLKASNGKIIATTEGYSSLSNARRAVASCVKSVSSYIELWADESGARFEVFEGADRRFYFNLYAQNGEIVLRSEGYQAEAGALNGAFATAEYGLAKLAYKILPATNGGYYVNLRAPNNEVVASSEVYSTKASAERARNAIIALLPSVELL